MYSRFVVLVVLLVEGTLCLRPAPISAKQCLTDCVYNAGYGSHYCFVGDDEFGPCNPSQELQYQVEPNSDLDGAAEDEELIQTLDGLMKRLVCFNDSCGGRRRRQTFPLADVRRVSVDSYAASLAQLAANNNLLVYSSTPNQSGVNRYAYLKSNSGGPTLPLLVSAKIDIHTVKPPRSRDGTSLPDPIDANVKLMGKYTNRPDGNDDENGHLIAYQNGGPYEIYNFVPMSRSVNGGIIRGVKFMKQSDWVRAENSINRWVKDGKGYVVQTVVVVYQQPLTSFRPVGLMQQVTYYNSNNSVRSSSVDYCTNDPMEQPTMEHIA